MTVAPSALLLVNQSIGPLFAAVVAAARRRQAVVQFQGLAYRRSPAWARLLTWGGYSLQLAWHLLIHGRRYQRLLVVSNPPLAPLLAPLARRPYALLLYDLYPQVLAQLQPRHPLLRWLLAQLVRLWQRANRVALARAERVFTLSEAMAAELRPAFVSEAGWRSKVVVIPPWADTTQLHPIPPVANPFRRQHGLDGRLLVSYSGNLGLTHPLEPLLEAAAQLNGAVQVLVIGTGPKRRALEQLARQLQLSPQALRFLDPLPLEQLPLSSAAADLAVVALDGPAASASLPSKTFTALACGTPLLALAPRDSALAALVRQHGCGVVVPPGPTAATELATVITALAGDPERCRQLGSAALAAARLYTPANAERLLEEWLGAGSPYS
ncbi:glycosyltransferase [Vulcanococcus limneticus]|uniref:glycosyltransferase n=1 Tax=Vulcanococcus limneticus TaxID=2170428 RepID=UPI00398BDABB